MSAPAPLTFVEELTLLALDDATGAPRPMPQRAFELALAGAVLADLADRRRIDTDPQTLVVLDARPTGDPLLDPLLAQLAAAGSPRPVAHWLHEFSRHRAALEEGALERLIARGILRRSDQKFLWVFGSRRYPEVPGSAERTEVRTRLAALILGDGLPDPNDAILLSLLYASHLAGAIFAGPEFRARAGRLAQLARMDLVGREVAAGIDVISCALLGLVPPSI